MPYRYLLLQLFFSLRKRSFGLFLIRIQIQDLDPDPKPDPNPKLTKGRIRIRYRIKIKVSDPQHWLKPLGSSLKVVAVKTVCTRVADTDPQGSALSGILGSWIRIRSTVESWIRIRIKVIIQEL
jgi:hypothetical protein